MLHNFINPLIVTHDGEFHADEVVGVSLLKLIYREVRIVRTRDTAKIHEADFVLDVGGVWNPEKRRFDHHQKSYKGEYASAGLVLKWLESEKLLDTHFVSYLQSTFLRGVDMQDTGLLSPRKGICTFSDIISFYNPINSKAMEYEYLEGFIKAVDFTMGFLERIKLRYIQFRNFQTKFVNYLENNKSDCQEILVMNELIPPWKEYLFRDPRCGKLLFVIFPENKHKWILHSVPKNEENLYSDKRKLPKEWAGLLEGDLVKKTKIKDAIFCHKQRFMAAFKTRKSALRAAEIALSC